MAKAVTARAPSAPSGIRVRMALVAAVLIGPMLVLALHLAYTKRADEKEDLEQRALAIARALAVQPSQTIQQARAQLEAVAPRLGDPYAPDCARTLEGALALQPVFEQLSLFNAKGDLVCAGRPVAGPVSIADREYFQRATAERRFQLAGLVQGRASKRWRLVALYPMESGAVAGLLDLGHFQQMVNALPMHDGALVSMVDRSGRIVARRPHDPALIGREIETAAEFRDLIRSRSEGVHEVNTLDGTRRIVAFAQVPGTPLFVRVGIPSETADAAARQVLLKSLLVICVALGLALAIGWATFRGLITAPLFALTRAAARLGAGDLSARTGLQHDTPVVGGLASKLDELASHGQRVTRALRTLSAGNRALLRERNESELVQAMCRVAVEVGGYPAAYVCYARHDEARSIDVAAKAGADHGFLDSVNLTWHDSEFGRGSVGRCIRSGERVILRSIAGDSGAAPWHAAARAHGFASIISLPLRVQGGMIGTFTLAAPEEDAFDADEVALLDEMAADLSFGIDTIRAESRRREAEHIAARALTHDNVVDLPNRPAFVRRVNDCILRGRANHEPVTVLDVHLGRLQDIFDSFGYDHGNSVLRQVAERLRRLPQAEDDLARLPIDDFGYVLCGHDAEMAARVAHSILDLFDEPVRIGDAMVDVRAAIGVSFFPGHGEDAETLVRRASIAAREGFRRELPYNVYGGATARENPARLALAANLRAAIETRQLLLNFQPKVTLLDGKPCGAEALVRWRHPERGLVPPGEFVPLAEEIGLIRPMTYQILDLAIRQQHAWSARGMVPEPLAINLSARNLYDPQLTEALNGMFGTWGLPRDAVHFEITEGALVDDPEGAKRVLARLADGGSKIYIDDFGTGYSSLNYLVTLPVHALKIDRSFVRQMGRSEQARSVVASVISMAHNLRLRVVAEGVETSEEARQLREMGCDEAQGYYFARPLGAEDYAAWSARAGAAR